MNSDKNSPADTYYKEWSNSIDSLKQREEGAGQLRYFLQVAENYFTMNRDNCRPPKFIIIGNSFPEELIYAVGETPFYILGGSLGNLDEADSMVPRDTDAVTQSILGYLINDEFHLLQNATVIIPVTSDSMRKLPAIIEKKFPVITVDFPPNKTSPTAKAKWVSEIHRIAGQLEQITHRKISRHSFQKSLILVNNARLQMRKFEYLTRKKNLDISGAMRLFVLNTYYFATDIAEWASHLYHLNQKLERQNERPFILFPEPKVLIMGSPIIFPNYKIPFLLQDIQLDIRAVADVMTQKIYTNSIPQKRSMDFSTYFDEAEWRYYEADTSSAYVDNITLLHNINGLTKQSHFDGVIYHVLKGQIEYDFELNRYEKFFHVLDIPVFRLETDYRYQDIEQLKIRMEAFKEMLVQNRYRKETQTP
jgi:benzoyl-CoA reductase/2-hydroxyglutaryl-CoA dehydratase subunit BcrC/BadD/HgdB